MPLLPLHAVDPARFERADVLKRLNGASRALAELKGVAASIPNQNILINTLTLQEARDSSAIENIVTTQDDLYREDNAADATGTAVKEVLRYRQALQAGFAQTRASGLLTLNTILDIQQQLECNRAGLRKLPGTALRDGVGRLVYEPPQDAHEVARLMGELERFIHDEPAYPVDPLVKMALIHHQFESIHPFLDGNGRIGRLLIPMILRSEGVLHQPLLYLSLYFKQHRSEYYRLLDAVRSTGDWEAWLDFFLEGVEQTAAGAVNTANRLLALFMKDAERIRGLGRSAGSALRVFEALRHRPVAGIDHLARHAGVSFPTASRMIESLERLGIVTESTGRRRNRVYSYEAFIAILSEERMAE